MAKKEAITVNLINRNYPPNPGVTGESASELVAFLTAKGIRVNVIHIDADYQKGGAAKQVAGNTTKLKTFYNGKNKFIRLASNVYESVRMIRTSRSLKPDVTICMTEPPLLNICAAMMFKKKEPWILWSMDLFPEALVAGNLLSEKSSFYKFLDRKVLERKPNHVIALGNHQAEYLRKKFGNELSFSILPCGVFSTNANILDNQNVPTWASPTKIVFGYCGNVGEAHSVSSIVKFVSCIDPLKHKLVLALYGAKANELLGLVTGKPGVEIVKFVNRDQLKFIDIHIASLKKEWVNVCVPSKTVSSVCAGSAFIYFGVKDSDNWGLLKDAGWNIQDEAGQDVEAQIASTLKEINEMLHEKKLAAKTVSRSLNNLKTTALEDIYLAICRLAG